MQRKKLEEIQIGILGLKNSGKTLFQTSLVYLLHYSRDCEKLNLEPVGSKTLDYINKNLNDLINGNFPKQTKLEIQLTYRLSYKTKEFLVNTIDYDGDELNSISSENFRKSEANSELQNFLLMSHAYILFIPVDEILKEDIEEHTRTFRMFIDCLRNIQRYKSKFSVKNQFPLVICITKTDSIGIVKPILEQRINNKLRFLCKELKGLSFKVETLFVSSVGDNFFDDKQIKKKQNAQLIPKNISQPIKFILDANEKSKEIVRVKMSLMIILLLFSILFVTGYILKSAANRKLDALKYSVSNVLELDDEELELKRFEIDDCYNGIGLYRMFIFVNVEEIKHNLIAQITQEQLKREIREIVKQKEKQNDNNIISNEERKYLKETDSKGIERLNNLEKEAYRKKDIEVWEAAKKENTVESYEDYIQECGNFGEYIEEAEKRILGLRKNIVSEQWHSILSYITDSPDEYKKITEKIRYFTESTPYELRRDIKPQPETVYGENIKKWDIREWMEITDYEDNNVVSDKGNIMNIRKLINMYSSYINLFENPINERKAKSRINFYNKVKDKNLYKVVLLKAQYLGGVDDFEKEPDIYIKVYVNDTLVIESKEYIIKDEVKPIWKKEFSIKWKAYDVVRIEIWDENLISDKMLCFVQSDSLTSAHNLFRNIYYPKKDNWKLKISFEWKGPKR